jgi:hypothetical protein
MNTFRTLRLSLALSILATLPAQALVEVVPVTVTGTLTTQGTTPNGAPKAVVTVVNNDTILADFNVTRETHRVAIVSLKVVVQPKAGGELKTVFTINPVAQVNQEKPKLVKSYGTLSPAPQMGTFNGFEGAYTATAKPEGELTKHIFNAIGSSAAGLLKFKVKGLSGTP